MHAYIYMITLQGRLSRGAGGAIAPPKKIV